MIRIFAASLALAVALGSPFASARQPDKGKKTPPGPKKPEVSASADFKPEKLERLAIIVTDTDGHAGVGFGAHTTVPATDLVRLVEDAFMESLLARGHAIAARSDVAKVLKEKDFQKSGLTEGAAKDVGKLLNTPAVLLVRITKAAVDTQQRRVGNATVTANNCVVEVNGKLVDVQTGSIAWSGFHTVNEEVQHPALKGVQVLKTATALAEAFPAKVPVSKNVIENVGPDALKKIAVIIDKPAPPQPARPGFGAAPKTAGNTLADHESKVVTIFETGLLGKKYQPVSRDSIDKLLKEQQFQKSGLTEDNAVEVGKLLDVNAMLLVRVTDHNTPEPANGGFGRPALVPVDRAGVSARLVEVQSGKILWVHADYTVRAADTKAEALLDLMATSVLSYLPPDPTDPAKLLERATRLELLGQKTAAKRWYMVLIADHAGKPQSKKAAERLKMLGD